MHNGNAPAGSNGRSATDWTAKAKLLAKALNDQRRQGLADVLGLPADLLDCVPIGWTARGPHKDEDGHGACWSIPEVDATGEVVGISCLYASGKKKVWTGGERGLTVPDGWRDFNGPILLPEGLTDTLTLTAMGLPAIGRPTNTCGVDLLAKMLRDFHAQQVIVLGKIDAQSDGAWPGQHGAVRTATELSVKLGRLIHWAMPPDGAKDVRAWYQAQGKPDGRDFLAGLKLHDARPGATVSAAFPDPVPLSQVVAVDIGELWLWHGFLAQGAITLLTALWKSGKSTLLAVLLKIMANSGELFGYPVKACKVLVISEEPEAIWIDRRERLNLGDNVLMMIRPMKAKPDTAAWKDFVAHVVEVVKANGITLVVFDTVTQLWPVKNENDGSEVTEALLPLRQITDAGAGLAMFHHPRKSDGQEGTSARGSGALSGFVDVILELRRFDAADRHCRKRVLTGYSRYAATPDEVVVELSGDSTEYYVLGDRSGVMKEQRGHKIIELLPLAPPGKTVEEILADWTGNEPAPAPRTLRGWLNDGMNVKWIRLGGGTKKEPHRWHRK